MIVVEKSVSKAQDAFIANLERLKQEVLDQAKQQVVEIERTIERLKLEQDGEAAQPPTREDSEQPVTPGQFKDMKSAPALQAYLLQRGGGPVKIDRCVADLEKGEADLGADDRHERNLKIAISMRKDLFRVNEKNGTVEMIRNR